MIQSRRRAYCDALAQRQSDALADFLEPDLVILSSNGALRIGRDEAIANYTGNVFRDPQFAGYDRRSDEVHVNRSGTIAVERGHWRALIHGKDGLEVTASGYFQAGWVNRDGTWRIQTESYVRMDQPPFASE